MIHETVPIRNAELRFFVSVKLLFGFFCTSLVDQLLELKNVPRVSFYPLLVALRRLQEYRYLLCGEMLHYHFDLPMIKSIWEGGVLVTFSG